MKSERLKEKTEATENSAAAAGGSKFAPAAECHGLSPCAHRNKPDHTSPANERKMER